MNKTTILTHIANFAEAIALVARELASSPEQAASPAAPPPVVEQPAPKKRGPKPKAEPVTETPKRTFAEVIADAKRCYPKLLDVYFAELEEIDPKHYGGEFKKFTADIMECVVAERGSSSTDATNSELTRDDLRLLFEPVVKRGDGPKVKEALKKYGVEKLADLEPKDFAAFKADIEVLLQ